MFHIIVGARKHIYSELEKMYTFILKNQSILCLHYFALIGRLE